MAVSGQNWLFLEQIDKFVLAPSMRVESCTNIIIAIAVCGQTDQFLPLKRKGRKGMNPILNTKSLEKGVSL